MRESKVEAYLAKRVTETGGLVRKVQWVGRNGAPDRLVGWPRGKVLWHSGHSTYPKADVDEPRHALIETKRPAKRAEAHQAREHERLRAIGFDVRVIDTLEGVDAFIKEMVGQ